MQADEIAGRRECRGRVACRALRVGEEIREQRLQALLLRLVPAPPQFAVAAFRLRSTPTWLLGVGGFAHWFEPGAVLSTFLRCMYGWVPPDSTTWRPSG